MIGAHGNTGSGPRGRTPRGGGWGPILLLAGLCLLLVGGDFLHERHPYFRFQEVVGINALMGVVGSALVILLGRALFRILGRDEDFYDE